MTVVDFIGKVIDTANKKGWQAKVTVEQYNPIDEWCFSTYTSTGQDLNVEVQMDERDVSTLITNLEDYFEAYDPEAETMLWLDSDGHGKNGAPYHMKDVLADMEEAWKKIH